MSRVYLIKENGRIVYVGMSKYNVVDIVYRHFYKWKEWWSGGRNNPTCRERITYCEKLNKNKYEIAILVLDVRDVDAIERALIVSLKPRDNAEKYIKYFEDLTKVYIKESVNDTSPF